MNISKLYRLSHTEPEVHRELNGSPYKYFHEWKYDAEIDFISDGWRINEIRISILEDKANEVANSSVVVVNWIFGIYTIFYILFSIRKWLYKK